MQSNLLPANVPDADDDAALAQRVVSGDRAAFALLMRRYNRRLYRLARATLRDDAEAEDALQEAYLSVYRALTEFRAESSLATWLSRVVLNECLGRLRKSARRQHLVPVATGEEMDTMASDDSTSPDRALLRAQVRTLVEQKLDEMPQDFRVVFVLRSVEELTVEETANALGIPEETVRSRHFRARGLLRNSLAIELDIAENEVFEFGGSHCDSVVETVLAKLGKDALS
jgi:RNA polymerase sigma-70 factor (ECF subfamily)